MLPASRSTFVPAGEEKRTFSQQVVVMRGAAHGVQLLNYSASALFAYLLGEVDLTVLVPVANASALLFNALTDLLLGQRYHLGYLSLGAPWWC